jgi:sterol 14-demethylase
MFLLVNLTFKECIRIQTGVVMFRQNTSGQAMKFQNIAIPKGSFVVYHIGDTYFDPKLYQNAERFDSARYLPDRAEDSKQRYAYVGFGGGAHPCRK